MYIIYNVFYIIYNNIFKFYIYIYIYIYYLYFYYIYIHCIYYLLSTVRSLYSYILYMIYIYIHLNICACSDQISDVNNVLQIICWDRCVSLLDYKYIQLQLQIYINHLSQCIYVMDYRLFFF